jgi:hypothetical protein
MQSCREGSTMMGTSYSRRLQMLLVAIFASVTVLLFWASIAVNNQTFSSSKGGNGVDGGRQGEFTCLELLRYTLCLMKSKNLVLLNVFSAMYRSHRAGKWDRASGKICVLKGLLLFCDFGIWRNCISTPAKRAII